MRTEYCGNTDTRFLGQAVTLFGWAHRRRDHGGVIFIDMRDREGLVQVVCHPERAATFAVADRVRNEFVLRVHGVVRRRPEGTVNTGLRSGEVEVLADELEILNPAVTPPFMIDDEVVSEEVRLKFRYLDLRREPMQKALRLRHAASRAARGYLDRNGFIEVETPVLYKSTPEGAREFLVPSRVHDGQFYALPQSPQLFKQLLMIAGHDRYYQIVKCFRDEDLRADRQPEFTQIDIEASFIGLEDVLGFGEGMVKALWAEAGHKVDLPIQRMRYAEALETYGTDKPDLRYGLPIFDATEAFRGADFSITRSAIKAGGRVRGIRVPGGATLTRKQVDEIETSAKALGAAGLLRIKAVGGTLEGPPAKYLPAGAATRLALSDGDLCLLVAGPDHVSSPALDRVRQELAQRLNLVPEGESRFVWIIDFPLFEKDPATGTLSPVNHPFTAPHPHDLPLLESAPEKARALAYDMVLNGTELGGGSLRIADPELQRRIFALLGIPDEEAQARFGFLLEGLRAGAPPHGGFAFGMDRIVMLLAGASSLRDVIAFPKTTAQRALFEGAPTPVDPADLRALHLEAIRER